MSKNRKDELLEEISRKLKDIVVSIDNYLELDKTKEVQRGLEMGLEKIIKSFPKNLRELLNFSEAAEHYLVKPKNYLPVETFAKIATIVRDDLKGKYISAGKDSRFEIEK